jgi:hypothetical protein
VVKLVWKDFCGMRHWPKKSWPHSAPEQQTIVSASKLFHVCVFIFLFLFSTEASLERFLRNEALAKKELASIRTKLCKDEAEARRMFGDVVFCVKFYMFCFSCFNCLFVIQFLFFLLFLGSWQSLINRIIEIAFRLLFFFIPT